MMKVRDRFLICCLLVPLIAWGQGRPNPLPPTLPGIQAGVRGMRFIERAIESSRAESWVEF